MNLDIKDQALKTLAKGAGFVFIGMILSKIFTYLYRIIVARIGTSEYGLLSLGLAVISIAMYIPVLGMDQGILRYVSYYLGLKDKQRIKGTITKALKIAIPLSILFTIILFFSSNFISIILHQPDLSLIIKILSLSLPFYTVGVLYLSVIKAYKRMDYWVLIKNILENFVKVLITYILILFGLGVIGATIGFTIASMFTFIIAVILVESKLVPIIKSKIVSIKQTKQLVGYSWPIMFNIILNQLLGWTDTLMIGFFKNPAQVGIYNAALPTAHIMTIIPAGIKALFIPIMTTLYAQKKQMEFIAIYKTCTKWIYYFSFYIFMIFIIFSKEILQLLFGTAYIEGSSTVIIIIIGYFIYSVLSPTTALLKVIEKTKLLLFNTIISTTLNIILNYILIPRYGMIGGAIASTISLTLWSCLGLIESYYITKIHPFKKGIFKLAIISFISFIAAFLLKDYLSPGLLGLVNGMIIAFGIYMALIISCRCLDQEDIKILKELKNKLSLI